MFRGRRPGTCSLNGSPQPRCGATPWPWKPPCGHYAPRFDGDVELWGATGLLHDLDYERYPSLQDGHPRYALRELEAQGYPPELVRAVASHADFMGVPRETAMEKTLYAVDELSGFVLACAY